MSASYPVYIGFWTNWSYGKVFGFMLTLERSDADLLIAFIAFSLTVIATQLWAISCFIFHTCYSSRDPQDTVHHQRQAVLRNNRGPVGTAWTLFQIGWAWRQNQKTVLPRIAPILGSCLLLAVGFAAAAGFSSRVTAGNEVLLTSKMCKTLEIDFSNVTALNKYIYPWQGQHLSMSSNYASRCYSNNSASPTGCKGTVFVQPRILPTVVNTKAGCPFSPELCVGQDSNLLLDTTLDSHTDLGINAPPHERFQVRKILHCAPLVTEGYKSPYRYSANHTFTRYHYGESTLGNNVTYQYPDPRDIFEQHGDHLSTDYSLREYKIS